MKTLTQIQQDTLKALASGQTLRSKADGGTIRFGTMSRLTRLGLIEHQVGMDGRVSYRLTAAGRAA